MDSIPSGSHSPADQNGFSTGKKPAKRGVRACLQCRKLKKTCEGLSAPCQRCRASGASCVFDKPASSVVDDAGLERLSVIEATLATQERRMNTIIEYLGEIAARLPAKHSSSSPFPSSVVGLGGGPNEGRSPISSSLNPTPPATVLPPIPYTPHSGSAMPSLNPPPLAPPIIPGLDPAPTTQPLPNKLAAKYQTLDRFASSVHTPIQALADAAERMLDGLPMDEKDLESMRERDEGDGMQTTSRKRPRLVPPQPTTAPPKPNQFDLVAKGLIGDREARAWVLLWHKELWPFCAILDPEYDTYESLRRRSPFLLNTMIYTAARTSGGNSPPSKELVAAAEETRLFAQNLIFETAPPLEVIQALILMACWHDEPYMLSGYALRMALSARMENTFDAIEAHGWEKSDATARRLIAQLRCWLYLVFLEFKHSSSTGRLILIQPNDGAKVDHNCEKIFRSPFSISTDRRTVANLRNVMNQRVLLRSAAALRFDDGVFTDHVALFRQEQQKLREWFERNDISMAVIDPSPLSWARRSHYRHVQDSILFLSCIVFKQSLLDPNAPPEVLEIAQEALRAARGSIQTVINSPAYYESIRFSGYLTRVDLSFCALLSLKLAQTPSCQNLPEAEDIADDVERLAEILLICSGSKRHAAVLRIAKDQFVAKMHPQRPQPPVSQPLNLTSPWSNPQQAAGNLALLPGENEIDWQKFQFELETSDLLPDWTPSNSLPVEGTWLDMFNQGNI